MRSLELLAQELAIVPELEPEEEEIVSLVISVGRRLTTTQILDEFNKRGVVKAESTIKGKLAQLTKRKVLVNRSDTSPKGYGLPEWA
jgi:repressor of nif and glnA expression